MTASTKEIEKALAKPGEPLDFVFCFRAQGTNSGLLDVIQVIGKDGKLQGERLFGADRKERLPGGIYRGARFDASTAWGLPGAQYAGRWEDRDQVMAWEARNASTKRTLAAKRMEKNEKAQSLIEEEMAGLRRLYRDLLKRGDYDSASSLEMAVARALHRPPRD